jgi:rhodanese-related sulfurtransferase
MSPSLQNQNPRQLWQIRKPHTAVARMPRARLTAALPTAAAWAGHRAGCAAGGWFDLGHLPGALNIPFAMLDAHLAALPKCREIAAYCRGPYCVFSFEAVATLRSRG